MCMARRAGRCYACGNDTTGRDHVPPLVFFPTADEAGKDLRVNLVTVPACGSCNQGRSTDDTYAAIVLSFCTHSENRPPEAYVQRLHELLRRNDKALAKRLVSQFQGMAYVNGVRTSALKHEQRRVDRVLVAIARGLLFNACGERIVDPVLQWNRGLGLHTDGPPPDRAVRVGAAMQGYLQDFDLHGTNPEVVQWAYCPRLHVVRFSLWQEWEFFVFEKASARQLLPD